MFKSLIAALVAISLSTGAQAATKKKPAAKAEAKVEEVKKEEAKAEPTPEAKATEEVKKEEPQKEEKKIEEAKTTKEVSHKSPALAGGLGVFPGVVVHGAGHMYAGSWMKGLGLLAIEGVSAGVGYSQGMAVANDIGKLFSNSGNTIPLDLSPALSRIGIIAVCGSAFLWSWFDDMAGAPIAADMYNRKADEAAQARLQVLPSEDGAMVALTRQF